MAVIAPSAAAAEDEDLPVGEVNALLNFCRDLFQTVAGRGDGFVAEHDPDGNHNVLKIACAAAVVEFSGGVYTTIHAKGLAVSQPGGYLAGRLLVELDDPAIESSKWHVTGWLIGGEADGPAKVLEDAEVATGAIAKTTSKTDVSIWDCLTQARRDASVCLVACKVWPA